MAKETISLVQLLLLMINFILGSSVVLGLGQEAGYEAWIGMGIGGIIGGALVLLYYRLTIGLGKRNLFEVFEYCIGRKAAVAFSSIYIIYFLYIASRVIRDFCELLSAAVLPNTPLEVMSLSLCLVIGYILYLGIEVLARTNEVFSPYLLFFIVILTVLLIASGNVDLQRMLPMFASGPGPLLKTVFPGIMTFPYGELIAFTVIFPLVTKKKHIPAISLTAVGIATATLMLASILTLTSLGVEAMQRSNFPLLTVARIISIGGFIERIEAIVVFVMMLGILVKSSVFLFGSLKGMEYIFKLPFRYFAVPGSMLIAMFSVLVSINFGDHIQEGLWAVQYFLHVPLQFALPIGLLILLSFKVRKKKRQKAGVHP